MARIHGRHRFPDPRDDGVGGVNDIETDIAAKLLRADDATEFGLDAFGGPELVLTKLAQGSLRERQNYVLTIY
jgi:hypothetical protein